MMSPEKVMEFKRLFEEQKENILKAHRFNEAQLNLPEEDLADEMDLTSSELEQSMRIRLRNRETLYLKKIEQALDRIKEGSYGECVGCGDTIEVRRLEVRPTTTHCVTCKEEEERREHLHADGRKIKSIGKKLQLKFA